MPFCPCHNLCDIMYKNATTMMKNRVINQKKVYETTVPEKICMARVVKSPANINLSGHALHRSLNKQG